MVLAPLLNPEIFASGTLVSVVGLYVAELDVIVEYDAGGMVFIM